MVLDRSLRGARDEHQVAPLRQRALPRPHIESAACRRSAASPSAMPSLPARIACHAPRRETRQYGSSAFTNHLERNIPLMIPELSGRVSPSDGAARIAAPPSASLRLRAQRLSSGSATRMFSRFISTIRVPMPFTRARASGDSNLPFCCAIPNDRFRQSGADARQLGCKRGRVGRVDVHRSRHRHPRKQASRRPRDRSLDSSISSQSLLRLRTHDHARTRRVHGHAGNHGACERFAA